jgi:hypothetical protein
MSIAAPTPVRGPRYTFTIPPKARTSAEDPESITLVALTMDQELMGNTLVVKSNNPWEKVKLSLAALDGKAVDWGTGQVDTALGKMSPKIREFVIAAFRQIHLPTEDETTNFLESVRVDL